MKVAVVVIIVLLGLSAASALTVTHPQIMTLEESKFYMYVFYLVYLWAEKVEIKQLSLYAFIDAEHDVTLNEFYQGFLV